MGPSLEISIHATPSAPQVVRGTLHAAYADAVPAVGLLDLKTVVTELITNSCEHGPGGLIQVSVEPRERTLCGAVRDGGRKPFTIGEIGEYRGLGLHMVDALCADWEVAPGGGSVSFQLPMT